MPSRIVLLLMGVALLAVASSSATADSARSTNTLVGPASASVAGAAIADQQTCENTTETVCLNLWPAGYGKIEATPEGGSTITCDYKTILEGPTAGNPCPAPVRRGSSVTLEAKAVEATAEPTLTRPSEFVRWSRAECQETGPCTFTPVEDDEWVAAIFTPLKLEVGIKGDGNVEASGLTCSSQLSEWPDGWEGTDASQVCTGEDEFPAEEQITLTAAPTADGARILWKDGFCEPEGGDLSSSRCTVTMTNIRTFASVGFGNEDSVPPQDPEPPQLPFEISPKVKVTLTGSGHGKVTGSGIDCPEKRCSENFGYQSRIMLTADADSGSRFVRWVGVCATDETCRFNAGSVTNVEARFDPLQSPAPQPPAPQPPAPQPPAPQPPAPQPQAPSPAPKKCQVPKVVGRRLAAARTRIRRANCSVGRIRYARSRRARGRVIVQRPRAGARRAIGARVSLVISRGRRR